MTLLSHWKRYALIAGLCLGALSACSKSSGPEAGSQTHFLVPCEDRCGGGYECICGVCTLECTQDGMCSSELEAARCIESDQSQECAEPVQMCDVGCRRDSECEPIGDRAFMCEAGRCRERKSKMDASEPELPPESDAAMPGDAGATDAGCTLVGDAGACVDPCPLDGGCEPVPPRACSLGVDLGPCDAGVTRYYHNVETNLCEPFSYGGCQGNTNNFTSRGECAATCELVSDAPCASDTTDPSLPGVRLHLEADTCRVPSGAPLQLRYHLELDAPIPYTSPSSGGACGYCRGYGSDPLTLVTYRLGNEERQYCDCDLGCCPPTEEASHTLSAGSFDALIDWPGTQWDGPSDTNAPPGEAFPPGAYEAKVTFEVPGVGSVSADLPLLVTPN